MTDNVRENIQKNLARYLDQSGLNQRQLAQKLHISKAAVSAWITGITTPDLDSVIKICEVFKVSADEQLYGRKKDSGYTLEEKLLIDQYRAHPELKQAVNQTLGLDERKEAARPKGRAAAKRDKQER